MTDIPDCAVCLQRCAHPVRLPCSHVFCFLCVKGVALQSKRCALCRTIIPLTYFNNPQLLRTEDLLNESCREEGYNWYYEGRNGWWQYDERTNIELEERYVDDNEAVFDLLIAGFLYTVDLKNMFQMRRSDPSRRRRIKRDAATAEKKGVAGLKVMTQDGSPSKPQSDKDDDAPAARLSPASTPEMTFHSGDDLSPSWRQTAPQASPQSDPLVSSPASSPEQTASRRHGNPPAAAAVQSVPGLPPRRRIRRSEESEAAEGGRSCRGSTPLRQGEGRVGLRRPRRRQSEPSFVTTQSADELAQALDELRLDQTEGDLTSQLGCFPRPRVRRQRRSPSSSESN